jgi:hypothetical protein
MSGNAPKPDQPTPPDAAEATSDMPVVSTQRRAFFREILFLGVQGAEKIAQDVGQKLADAVEQSRESEPNADPPPLKLDPPDGVESR